MDLNNEEKSNEFGLQVKISERPRSQSPPRKNVFERSYSPPFKNHSYESYFLPLETDPRNDTSLIGRVSFGTDDIDCEVNNAIETYSRRLALTKQQLSLVEEESTQDLESVPSQNLSSLSPENSIEVPKDIKNDNAGDFTGRDTYVMNTIETYPEVSESFFNQTKTYNNFYDDLRSSNGQFKNKMSSTAVHTDSSSKDSGYHDSGGNNEKSYVHDYSLPTTASIKDFDTRKKLNSEMESEPKSLDSASNSNDKAKNYQLDKKCNWMEPLNHSRLLYKDFFLKKEGHIPIAPQNSPIRSDIHTLNISEPKKHSNGNENPEYPSYLRNCTTKAYTSRVIEDYKKELEAINCLHELTLKDIKTEAISPTPLNIDKMFEENSNSNKNESHEVIGDAAKNNNILDCNKRADISKVSTKELIQKYLKVKGGDYCHDEFCKSLKKLDKKSSNADSQGLSKSLNNTNKFVPTKSNFPVNVKNQTRRNIFTATTPLSARIESVQNDKDVDSWISLSSPSPRNIEIETSQYPVEEAVETKSSEESDKVEIPVVPSLRDSKAETYAKANDVKETPKELNSKSTVLDIYSMLKEIESYADNPVTVVSSNHVENLQPKSEQEEMSITPKDNFMEIFEFLEKVEQSANDALSVVTNTTPHTTPKLETLLKLPQTELAQRLVTASLQLEERSCCIALLQESLTNNKEQMINKVSNLEKQSHRNVAKVKLECEEAIKRHQSFIDQLINDKKTLNHRIEQLVSERRSLEEKWERSAQALEERYKLELRNQRDKMAAAQQVARQRWVRQKAEKIKELTVKGLEGELREMAERQQKEVADLKMSHAEQCGRTQTKHAAELEDLRRKMEEEKEAALLKERQMASARLEKQILELESSYQEQRSRLVAEMRAENERAAAALAHRETATRGDIEKWREAQEKILQEKKLQMEQDILKEREKLEEEMKQKNLDIEKRFEQYKKDFESEQAVAFKKKVTEISAQHKQERDREIEKAIDTLEAEAHAGRRDLQEAMKRNKEQYEVELKELGETRQATLRRYQEAQARVRQTEDKCAELEVVIGQIETRNKVLIEKNTQLENQLEDVRKSCEASWQEKLDNAKKEIEDSRRTHEEQMHQLYAKVKVAVARKDSAIQALTRETAKYQEKITMLEQKLQQQRKDFLKHK